MTASKHIHGHLRDGLAYQILFDFDSSRQAFKVEQYLAHVGAGILKRKTKRKKKKILEIQ